MKTMIMIITVHAVSFIAQNLAVHHGGLFGYDQLRYHYRSDVDYYEWPKKPIRRLRPRRNRIYRIGEDIYGRDFYEDSGDSRGCECSCDNCVVPKRCCAEACAMCSPRDLVYVPYPVPLVVTVPADVTTADASTTTSTWAPVQTDHSKVPGHETQPTRSTVPLTGQGTFTKTQTETGSTAPPILSKLRYCPPRGICRDADGAHYHRNKYQGLLSDRPAPYAKEESEEFLEIERILRQTRPDRLPKYGIVSLPDNLAKMFGSEMH
ncbi:unnamed protein product, partial [Iphiclides podalirius]